MRSILLFALLNLSALAQTPTQVDYNTQIRNKPTTYTAVPGTDTLAAAIGKTPTGGTLVLQSGTYTMNSGVSVSRTLSIFCVPGAILIANTGPLTLLTVTGNGVSIQGCTFNANSHSGINAVLASGATQFSASYNIFTGTSTTFGICVAAFSCTNASGNPSVTGIYLAHNRFIGIYQGDTIWQADAVEIASEYGEGLTGDLIFASVGLSTFTNGATLSIHDFDDRNGLRYCMEWAGNGYRWIDFSNNSCTLSTSAASGGFSGGTDADLGASDQLIGGVIHGNSVYSPATPAGSGSLGFELLGHDYSVTNNKVSGPGLQHGFIYSGYGFIFDGNTVTTVGTTTAGVGFGPEPGNSTHDNTFRGNTTTNAATLGIEAGFDGDIIDGNHDFRACGAFSSDVSPGTAYASILINGSVGSRPATVQNNDSTLTTPINGCSLASPGGFAWYGFFGTVPKPVQYLNNKVTNTNATAFGVALITNNPANLKTTEISNRYSNLVSIHTGAGASNVISYGNNFSVIGAGSGSAPQDFSTIPYFPGSTALAPTSLTCTPGTGAGSGATCSATVASNTGNSAYYGHILLTTGAGTTGAGAAPLTLTFPAGYLPAIPVCVGSNGYITAANSVFIYDFVHSTATTVNWLATSSIADGTIYEIIYVCPGI